MSQLELPFTAQAVHVDVVRPGRALVTIGDEGGEIVRDGRRYRVEDADGVLIGHASSYRAGAGVLARFLGVTPGSIEIEHEHRNT